MAIELHPRPADRARIDRARHTKQRRRGHDRRGGGEGSRRVAGGEPLIFAGQVRTVKAVGKFRVWPCASEPKAKDRHRHRRHEESPETRPTQPPPALASKSRAEAPQQNCQRDAPVFIAPIADASGNVVDGGKVGRRFRHADLFQERIVHPVLQKDARRPERHDDEHNP